MRHRWDTPVAPPERAVHFAAAAWLSPDKLTATVRGACGNERSARVIGVPGVANEVIGTTVIDGVTCGPCRHAIERSSL